MIFIALGLLLLACGASGNAPPDKLGTYYYYFFDWRAEQHLRAMTRELLKDVELKMHYADFIFASYGGKINPEADKVYSEVGYLDSAIQKKFRYMCAMYRQHTHIDDFMRQKYSIEDMVHGNQLIQSAYHEILILKDLQNKALDKKEAVQKKERAMQFFMEFQMKQKTYKPPSRWRRQESGKLRYEREGEGIEPRFKKEKMDGRPRHIKRHCSVEWVFQRFRGVLYKQCLAVAANSKDLAPWLNELSEQNYLNLVNVSDATYNESLSKSYYHIDPKAMLRQKEPPDLTEANQKIIQEMKMVNPGLHQVDKENVTYTAISVCGSTMKTHIILRYENPHVLALRPYSLIGRTRIFHRKIGYLTHVIVSKYMNMLELYEMVDYRFVQHPTKNYGPLSWVWFMYTNILECSRAIIHWCNMMNEIKKKYGVESGTSKDGPDYETITTPDPEDMEVDKFLKNLHKNYQADLVAKKKKMLESRLNYKKGMKNPSMNLTTTRTKRPPQFWKWRTGTAGYGKDYGWSMEEFFN